MEALFLQTLALIVLLQVKHLFADYFLQTPIMLQNRARYLHFGRFLHVCVHLAGSLIAFLVIGAPVGLVIGLLVAEGFLHFHIDFCKAWWSDKTNDSPDQAIFWRAHGTDQAAHQLTYVGMAAVWAMAAI